MLLFEIIKPVVNIFAPGKKSLALLLLMITSNLPVQASEPVCIAAEILEVNGVAYMGPSGQVIEKLGKPQRTKTQRQASLGSSEPYFMKTYVYKGAKIITQNGPNKESLVEGWALSSPHYVMGNKLRVGMDKKDAARFLKINSDSEVPSVTEAKKIYAGETPRLSGKKSSWALPSCTLYPETTFIEFYFNQSQKLSKIIVLHDDSSI